MKLDAPVSDIMSTQVYTVGPDQKLVDVKHLFEKSPFHHHIPVVREGKIVGILSLVDFMRAIGSASLDDKEAVYQRVPVKEIMSSHPVSVKPGTPVKKVAKELTKGEVHALLITEGDELKGIVSYVDVIKYLLRVLD